MDSRRRQSHNAGMAILKLIDLPAALPAQAPVVGLDLGEKTIGVAVSDIGRAIASPLELIRKTKFTDDAHALFALMDGRGAKGVIIGLPVNMDGSEGPRCQSVRAFGRNLLRLNPDLPIAFWDERLSTQAVQRMMTDEADLSRARRAELVDKMAAAYILQGALDRLGYARP
jgi:putative Holliday junction resolvase